MRSLRWLFPLATASLLFACSDEQPGGSADSDETNATEIALTASSEPLKSFNYDTGLIPAGSPAQVQLKLSAGGGIKIEATGTPSAKGLEGKKGSGKVAIDLHVKLDGRLKSDSALGSSDGDLPGLEDIDIAIKGTTSFDPFLVGDKDEAKLDAKIPAADLPDIPLGATPGKLKLSVVEGSVLHSSFKGSCVSVSKEKASFAGELKTSGNLILKGTLAVEAFGLEKSVDLGQIEVPIPALTTAVDFASKDAKGAKDGTDGAQCGAPKKSSTSSSPAAPSASNDGDEAASVKPADTNDAGADASPAQTACAEGSNHTFTDATDLGSANDTDELALRTKTIPGRIGGDEENWYRLAVRDQGLNGNPNVRVTVDDPNLEVLVTYLCDAGGNVSTCSAGTPDASYGHGCRAVGSASLDTSCNTTNESGIAYVRVRASDETCRKYSLKVVVE